MIRFLPEMAPRRYSMAKRILVVDDDENILNLEKTILEQKGFDVTGAGAELFCGELSLEFISAFASPFTSPLVFALAETLA